MKTISYAQYQEAFRLYNLKKEEAHRATLEKLQSINNILMADLITSEEALCQFKQAVEEERLAIEQLTREIKTLPEYRIYP